MRAELKRARQEVPASERRRIDKTIAQALAATEAWRTSQVVFTYLSFGAEVDTRAIIERAWEGKKVVALPRCVEGTRLMEWYRVSSYDSLMPSRMGMLEPPRDPRALLQPGASPHELAIVPALTFDAQGYRLGYGGGYYDTFLEHFSGVSIGLCRAHALSADLRAAGVIEPHDLPVDLVITENGVFKTA